MSSAVPTSGGDRTSAGRADEGRGREKRSFFVILVAIASSLLLLGGLGFGYLRVNSPLGLLAGSDRPIAAATVFVPSSSPFTVSLLTKPERLIALQQAVVEPSAREQARREAAQVQQTLLALTGLDYERDIQPWVGEEITYAYTNPDLDQSAANGQQPGYLLAVEIASGKQQQAQSFLQLFWQQQSLVGNVPQSQKISGVRVLSGLPNAENRRSATNVSAVTALVGNQFVLFANDVRVIRRSVRASQTAQNLAQNVGYRQVMDTLPAQRIGLAYVDMALLNRDSSREDGRSRNASPPVPSAFAAVGIGVMRTGLRADLSVVDPALNQRKATFVTGTNETPVNTTLPGDRLSQSLQYLPANSELAVVGDSFAELALALRTSGVPSGILPEFLQLGQSLPDSPWEQLTTDYALGQISSGASARGGAMPSSDWILAVKHEEKNESTLQVLNQAAAKAGYSVVPVPLAASPSSSRSSDELADRDAMAWTRFKVGGRRQSDSGLETELLGLHLQQDDYEIYASSLAAMKSAMAQFSQQEGAALSSSLLASSQFLQAMTQLDMPEEDYLYVDWPAISPAISQVLPVVGAIDRAARPLTSHIRAVTATRHGDHASFFIQMKEIPS